MIRKNSPRVLVGGLFALLALEGAAWAQPDTCTVSVLNQTAHVQAAGSAARKEVSRELSSTS
jgi:hypothetical protein